MRTHHVIIASCLLGGLLSSASAQQENEFRHPGRPQRQQESGSSQRFSGQSRMGGGPSRMGGEVASGMMRQTMIAQFVGNPEVARKLGLTEEQTKTIKESLTTNRMKQIRLGAEQEIAAMEQVRLLTADEVDEEAVMAAVEKTGALSIELAKLRIQPILTIKKVLTKEQLEEAQGMIRKHARERGGPGSRRGRGDQPEEGGEMMRPPMGGEGGDMMPPPPPMEGEQAE